MNEPQIEVLQIRRFDIVRYENRYQLQVINGDGEQLIATGSAEELPEMEKELVRSIAASGRADWRPTPYNPNPCIEVSLRRITVSAAAL